MEEKNEQTSKKKQYETPKLVRHGDLVEVTRSFGNMGNIDSAGVGTNHKTA